MSNRPAIAVLLACHNRRSTSLACLRSLAEQDVEAILHPVVYDDGCSDGTAAAIRAAYPMAEILPGTGNAYWAGGMRCAFEWAMRRGFDHCLWLNDDVVLAPDAVARLLAAERQLAAAGHRLTLVGGAVADPASGAFAYGGIVRRRSPLSRLRFSAVPPSPEGLRACDTLHGNVVLVPARTAKAVGSIGRAYRQTLGDLDYGLRVRRAGGVVVLAPGYVGTCGRNPRGLRFFDPGTPLRERWRLLAEPLGFPLRPWVHFARVHGGPLWPIAAALPFWRLVVPTALALSLSRRGTAHARPA